ncbi:MAG: site-specific integrase [Acidithiobacillus sp.]|nr:site-specific integrase [Acidithiobacillus sp.]
MATIRSREDQDGITIGWQAQIKRKGFPLVVKTFRTKTEATQWATITESEMMRGVFIQRSDAERTTLAEVLSRYVDEVLPGKRSRQPVQSVAGIVSKHLGRYSLAALSPAVLAKYRDDRLRTGLSGQTVLHELSLISRVLNLAMKEWGIAMAANPVLQIKMPEASTSRDRRLVDDEEERLLSACADANNPWLRPVVIFAIETAMRAGEMLETRELNKKTGQREKRTPGLQWADVDLKKRTAHLPKTKNGEARTVPLSSRAVSILEALPRNLDGRVFGTIYDTLHQSYVLACKRASIDDLRFHDLRHEATSRFFEKGFNPMEVSAITGHKTLQMLKRYTHLRAEDLAKRMG